MTLKEYFGTLKFDFIETYSFHRGPQLDRLLEISEYTDEEIHKSVLINGDGTFNKTSHKIASVRTGTKDFAGLEEVIERKSGEILSTMCVPIYRDALVFRSDGKEEIVDVLNICFGCMYMKNSHGTEIDAGMNIYDALSNWFKQIGHSIDGDETLRLYKKLAELKKKTV